MTSRQLLPWERNFLARHAFDFTQLEKYGEMPVEYIVARAQFLDLEIEVNQDVLIPRVETEELVTMVTSYLQENFSGQTFEVLELGTGSGAVSVYLAKNFPAGKFLASDISPAALAVARRNAAALKTNNLQFLISDLLENISPDFFPDVVIANLPYIPVARRQSLPASVRDFEPNLALFGGADGFALIDKLLTQLSQRATTLPNNSRALPRAIFLEIDESHTSDFFRRVDKKYSQLFSWQILPDFAGKNRFALGQRR